MRRNLLRFGFSMALALGLSAGTSAPEAIADARTPKTCVAILSADAAIKSSIEALVISELESRGISAPVALSDYVQFETGLAGLSSCLYSGYEDVTIIAHSEEALSGTATLVAEERVDGAVVDFALDPRFFEKYTTTAPPHALKQLTLICCKAQEVLASSTGLQELITTLHLTVKTQAVDSQDPKADLTRLGPLTAKLIVDNALESKAGF